MSQISPGRRVQGCRVRQGDLEVACRLTIGSKLGCPDPRGKGVFEDRLGVGGLGRMVLDFFPTAASGELRESREVVRFAGVPLGAGDRVDCPEGLFFNENSFRRSRMSTACAWRIPRICKCTIPICSACAA